MVWRQTKRVPKSLCFLFSWSSSITREQGDKNMQDGHLKHLTFGKFSPGDKTIKRQVFILSSFVSFTFCLVSGGCDMASYSSPYILLFILYFGICESQTRHPAEESEENPETFRKQIKKSVILGPIYIDPQKYFKVFVNLCRLQIQIFSHVR